MTRLFAMLALGLAFCGAALAVDHKIGDTLAKPAAAPDKKDAFKTLDWDSLLPKGWDPMKGLSIADLGMMTDGDPRAQELLMKLQDAWEHAPVEPALDGARIRIAGFMVPLETAKGAVSEFLLVPYFGACIHVPPPPANQIIHVIADKPAKGFRTMDPVWVVGVLKTTRSETHAGMGLASAAYRMNASSVAPYKETKPGS
jgi:hypothetical protein